MYLSEFKITNYRKFGTKNNIIQLNNAYAKTAFTEEKVVDKLNLIVGMNNSGKTTILSALEGVISGKLGKKGTSNINIKCLNDAFENNKEKDLNEIKFSDLGLNVSFQLRIIIEKDKFKELSFSNIAPFIKLTNIGESEKGIEVIINVEYQMENSDQSLKQLKEKLKKSENEENILSSKSQFINLIDCIVNEYFSCEYYTEEFTHVKLNDLKSIINLSKVNANRLDGSEKSLNKGLAKIIKYKNLETEELDKHINEINQKIEALVDPQANNISDILNSINGERNIDVDVFGKLTLMDILEYGSNYMYRENDNIIPESQFGLGFSSLCLIIVSLIEYIEKCEKNVLDSVNIVCIEEPEVFMHPQMQENFIQNLENTISKIFNGTEISTQLLITTHSVDILHSKIKNSFTLDNINYLKENNIAASCSNVLNLSNSNIGEEQSDIPILKYINHKVAKLFFAEAVIIVEGNVEEEYIRILLSQNNDLKDKYITILNIIGAYAHKYLKIINALEIPCVIVTDLDIDRKIYEYDENGEIKKDEKKNKIYEKHEKNICDLANFLTTNDAISAFSDNSKKLDEIKNENSKYPNTYLTTQNASINGYYATTFEEAFILHNYDNEKLQNICKKLHPQSYHEIVKDNNKNIKENSYQFFKKIIPNDDKSKFIFSVIEQIFQDESSFIEPTYIKEGLNWMSEILNKNGSLVKEQSE